MSQGQQNQLESAPIVSDITVYLWSRDVPGSSSPPRSSMPTVCFEDNNFSAPEMVAVSLRHFLERGYDVFKEQAVVDVDHPEGFQFPAYAAEVLPWLNKPEQAAYVEREGLTALLR
jgi:hypothetical protein